MLNGETAGLSTAEATQSTLGDDIAALLGDDIGGSSESPETETQGAGAPPAPTGAQSSETAQAGSEGTNDAEHAGAPPADAANPSTAPDNGTPANDDDPLAGAEPFAYTVNSQSRTFDGITKLKIGGAIVTPDALPKLQQRLSERDNLFERQQEQYQRYAALEESFNKLTQWSIGKDQNGQDRVLSGVDAVEAQRVLLGRSAATLQVLAQALDDPRQFARLVAVVDDGKGGLAIVPDQDAIANLKTLAENAAIKAERAVTQHFQSVRASLKPLPQQPSTRAPSSNAELPAIEPSVALESVKGFVAQMEVKGLTAEDEAFLAELLPQYIRPATPAERAQYNSPVVVSPGFGKLIQRTAQLRASVAQTATATAEAARENQRKLAAAASGSRPNRPAAPRQAQNNAPATPREASNSDKAWELHERLAAGKLGR